MALILSFNIVSYPSLGLFDSPQNVLKGKTPSGVPHPALERSPQKGHRPDREGPDEGHEDNPNLG